MEPSLKETIFPLPIEDLKGYVLGKESGRIAVNPEPKFVINYAKSGLKGKHFLSYGTNLELSYLMTQYTSKDLIELMDLFLHSGQFHYNSTVVQEVIKIFLEDKEASILTPDEWSDFTTRNSEVLNLWGEVFRSLMYVIPTSFKWFSAVVGDRPTYLKERNEVAVNAGALVIYPSFLENYISLHPVTDADKQWFMFLGDSLYYGNCFLNFFYAHTSFVPLLYVSERTGEQMLAQAAPL